MAYKEEYELRSSLFHQSMAKVGGDELYYKLGGCVSRLVLAKHLTAMTTVLHQDQVKFQHANLVRYIE